MGGGANAVNSLFPAEHPADEIRATKQPETGPLTKGLNAAIETHADAVESAVADAVTQTRRQQTAPIVGQLRALPPEQQDEALQMMAVADNMRAPGPVRRRAQNRLDFLLGSVAPPVDAGVDPAAGEIAAPALPADEVPAPEIAETGRDQRPVSEAPPVDDPTAAIAQREADRPAPTITPRQDDDILTASGNPFLNMTSAMRALGRAGEGFELARVDGGLVVRRAAPAPNDAEVTTPITEASPAPALTTRPQPTTTGAAVIDARPSGTRGTSASDVLPANSATAAQPVSPQAPVGQPVEGAGNPQPTLAAPSATQATDLEDRLINVRDGARRWFSSDAEDGGRDYAGEYQALDDNGTPEFAAAAERILSDYKAARAKSFQPTREVDAASRQAAVERAGQPDTRTPPEVAFDQSPELAIQALTAAQQDAMGKELRVSRAKRTSVGFIEALAGKARAEVRSAYLKAAAPNDPNQSSRATPEAAEAPRSEAPAPARIDAAAPASVPAAGGTAAVEAGGVAAPAAPAPSKKRTVPAAKAAAAREAKLADYFAPGNVVKSYGGHDRVVSFHPATEAEPRWAAVVHSVIKKDGQWVDDPNDNRERQHATEPSEKELKAGPVARAPVKEPAPEILASKTEQDRPALGETTASVSVRPGGGEQLTDPFSNDFAVLEGKTVEQQVTVAETGQTATLRMDAAKAMRDIESRQQALEQLKKCIGKSK